MRKEPGSAALLPRPHFQPCSENSPCGHAFQGYQDCLLLVPVAHRHTNSLPQMSFCVAHLMPMVFSLKNSSLSPTQNDSFSCTLVALVSTCQSSARLCDCSLAARLLPRAAASLSAELSSGSGLFTRTSRHLLHERAGALVLKHSQPLTNRQGQSGFQMKCFQRKEWGEGGYMPK